MPEVRRRCKWPLQAELLLRWSNIGQIGKHGGADFFFTLLALVIKENFEQDRSQSSKRALNLHSIPLAHAQLNSD